MSLYQAVFNDQGALKGRDFTLQARGMTTNQPHLYVTLKSNASFRANFDENCERGGNVLKTWRVGEDGSFKYRALLGALKRSWVNERVRTWEYTNNGAAPAQASFALNGGIQAVDLSKVPGNALYCCPEASWLLSGSGNDTSYTLVRNFMDRASLLQMKPLLMKMFRGDNIVVVKSPDMPTQAFVVEDGQSFKINPAKLLGHTDMRCSLGMSGNGVLSTAMNKENKISLVFHGPGIVLLGRPKKPVVEPAQQPPAPPEPEL